MIDIITNMHQSLIATVLPAGAEALGLIRHPTDGMPGVLCRLGPSLVHVSGGGVVRTLPQRESRAVAAQLAAEAEGDALVARLLSVVDASGDSHRIISERARQRPGWLDDLLQGWRGSKTRRGREPTLSTLELLARGLGLTLGELLGPELLDRHHTAD